VETPTTTAAIFKIEEAPILEAEAAECPRELDTLDHTALLGITSCD
jgi:hypothetical protein